MADQDQIKKLLDRLEHLVAQQEQFSKEISTLKSEINKLNMQPESTATPAPLSVESDHAKEPAVTSTPKPVNTPPAGVQNRPPGLGFNLEKFVGENLINKIGIAITVIGVGIGAKYAIDNQLINPLLRIILGYLVGLGLLFFAYRLKSRYHHFSAVLLSGAMAILYFITFAAYDFYSLIPQPIAFVLMVVFTAFTALAAIYYNLPVIAHIGMVGAYGVPFLLSDGSGNVHILFSYMTIINCGILFLAFRRYWKSLYFVSFGLTWLIYIGWYLSSYDLEEHLFVAPFFGFLFFIQFYLIFLGYKILQKEHFAYTDIMMMMSNAFIFYATGYSILNDWEAGQQWLGVFTLGNAGIHFIASALIYQKKLADRNLFFLIAGMVLVFLTMAIPVQLDGQWVTILWGGEMTLLFWLGRTRKVAVYEKMAYGLMCLTFISIWHDWEGRPNTDMIPFFNIGFFTGLLISLFLGITTYIQTHSLAQFAEKGFWKIISYGMPTLLLIVTYVCFLLEIDLYWEQRLDQTAIDGISGLHYNVNLYLFSTIWKVNYTLGYLSILSIITIRWIRQQVFSYIVLGLNSFAVFLFLSMNLYLFSELRSYYLNPDFNEYFAAGPFHIWIRYLSLVLLGGFVYLNYRFIQQDYLTTSLRTVFDISLTIGLLWTLSSELIHWLDMAGSDKSHKLGLSILWGSYSLIVVIRGMMTKKPYLRIGAMVLFGITLIKLFFYDISSQSTLSKTIVFLVLGILLLIISFLYNKYKDTIFGQDEK